MNTMCSDISNAQNWPMDEITCDIQLGIIHENITLRPAVEDFFKVNCYGRSAYRKLLLKKQKKNLFRFQAITTIKVNGT